MKGPRLKPVFAALGVAAFLFTWELLSYGQVQLFFNKVFVAYRTGDPNCEGVGGGITHGQSGSDPGDGASANGGSGENESVSYIGAPRANSQPPAMIQFNPATWQAAGKSSMPYPGSCLDICAQLGYNNKTGANIPVDTMIMEVFKFLPGIDPLSAPPVRTFTFAAIGEMSGSNSTFDVNNGVFEIIPVQGALPDTNKSLCAGWDGSYNVEGEFGRTNGQFGFRARANVHQQNPQQGNITIQTDPPGIYPGMEKPGDGVGSTALQVGQSPITIDVMDVHVVRSSPNVVGVITGVPAQPYNLMYRLSKDATAYVYIVNPNPGGTPALVRSIATGVPRIGEGTPNGTLTNGDFWDGRDEFGNLMPAGVYNVYIEAVAQDNFSPGFGTTVAPAIASLSKSYSNVDYSGQVVRQLALDPLQITDIRIAPLLDGSTALATISYLLTEDATAYVDIYPPGTSFNNQPDGILTNYNNVPGNSIPTLVPSSFLTSATPERSIQVAQRSRVQVLNFWDGRDANGRILEDGDYPFLLYAQVPSQAGHAWGPGLTNPPVIWTSKFQTGFLSVLRGLPGITQITPRASVAGSTPAVGGLNPFNFTYALTRDSIVSVKIFRSSNTIVNDPSAVVKTLVNQETRPANFTNVETWPDIYDDHGLAISSGIYVVQLTAQDPYFPSKISTVTASFPIDLFRITDLATTPLLSGASDQALINYQLTQPMNVTLALYPPGTIINRSITWPPCGTSTATSSCNQITDPSGNAVSAVNVITGMRPGRLKVTEFWDGRTPDGTMVTDGAYPFALVAQSTSTPAYYASDRVVGAVTIARGQIQFSAFQVLPTIPSLVNSSDTISLPPFEVDYVVSRQSSVTVQALTTTLPSVVVRTILAGGIRDASILNKEFWDARDDSGNFVPPGFYTVRVVAKDIVAQLISGSTQQITVAVDPLRIYDVAVSPVTLDNPAATIEYQVSEPMKVAVKIYKPGTSFDINKNPSPPDAVSLVRRIVSIKPSREPIKDFWDGRDFKLTLVPDGNYVFRIQGSTDVTAIDNFTGDIRPGAQLAEDVIVSELAVVRGGSNDPEADFINNTIVYPNPIRTPQATFQIHVPVQANVFLKIYNLAGELIRSDNLGNVAGGQQAVFTWNRDNASGKQVAHGVYFAVIREEGSAGDATVFQTVKKILIP